MDPAQAALIGAFGGALIGLAGTLAIDQIQSRRASQTEIRRAYAAFLGALYPVVGELQGMPPNRSGGAYEWLEDKVSTTQARWVGTQRAVAKTSPQLFGRIDRLMAAAAFLQVLSLPEQMSAAVTEAMSFVEALGENRSSQVLETWPEIQRRLVAAKDAL